MKISMKVATLKAIANKINVFIDKLELKIRLYGILSVIAMSMASFVIGFIVMQDHEASSISKSIYIVFGFLAILWLELYLSKIVNKKD